MNGYIFVIHLCCLLQSCQAVAFGENCSYPSSVCTENTACAENRTCSLCAGGYQLNQAQDGCEEQTKCKDCGTPGPIQHGRLNLAEAGNSGFGALANVVCEDGYESGDMTVSCLETGMWNTTTCNPKDCGTPYNISYGEVTPVTEGNTVFGARANIVCDVGFEIKGNCKSTQFQCGYGSCIADSSKCDNVPDCPDELDELLCPGKASCAEGQTLCGTTCVNSQDICTDSDTEVTGASNGTISCLVIGIWEIVKCEPKVCGTLSDIANGNISLTQTGQTIYRSTANVMCDTGYAASLDQIFCQANGTWESASCIVDCGAPKTIDNGNLIAEETGKTTYNSRATVTCDTGFYSLTNVILCQADGSWEDASCIIKDCGDPDTLNNGQITVEIEGKTTYLSNATVSCEKGYDVKPSSAIISCQADGKWQAASCSIKVEHQSSIPSFILT